MLINISFALAYSAERRERARVEIDRTTIRLTNFDIYANCCAQFHSEIHIEKDGIAIFQTDTSTERCKCYCYLDLDYKISNVKPGRYQLRILREERRRNGYPRDTIFIAYTEDIVIKAVYAYGPLLFANFQSDCKSGSETSQQYTAGQGDLSIFPNPASSTATLRYRNYQDGEVKIALYNLLGKEVLAIPKATQTAGMRSLILDMKDLPQGIYIGKLYQPGGKVKTFKIVWSK